jgi:hypothetical protein
MLQNFSVYVVMADGHAHVETDPVLRIYKDNLAWLEPANNA